MDLAQAFWLKDAERHFTPTETRMFFALAKLVGSGRGCLSDAEMSAEVGVCMATMRKARARLEDAGLITVEAGNGRGCKTVYTLPDKGEGVPQPQEPATVDEVASVKHEEVVDPPQVVVHTEAEEERPKPRTRAPRTDLFEREDLKPKRKSAEPIIPTLEEVVLCFHDKGVADYRKKAEYFYYHYDSLGWCTSNGVKVKRWESLVNKWLLREEKEKQKFIKTETGDGSAGNYKENLMRRIAEADAGFRKSG